MMAWSVKVHCRTTSFALPWRNSDAALGLSLKRGTVHWWQRPENRLGWEKTDSSSQYPKPKRFTYFIFSRTYCFVSSCLADCWSGLLIAVIDTEESDAGCQKPQKKEERTLSLPRRWGEVDTSKSLPGMQGLCWRGEELQGATLWCAREKKTQLLLMNEEENKKLALGMQLETHEREPAEFSLSNLEMHSLLSVL